MQCKRHCSDWACVPVMCVWLVLEMGAAVSSKAICVSRQGWQWPLTQQNGLRYIGMTQNPPLHGVWFLLYFDSRVNAMALPFVLVWLTKLVVILLSSFVSRLDRLEDMALSTAWLELFWVYNRDTPRVCCIFRNLTFISFIGHCSAMLPWKEFLLWSRKRSVARGRGRLDVKFQGLAHCSVFSWNTSRRFPDHSWWQFIRGLRANPVFSAFSCLHPGLFFDSKHGVFGFPEHDAVDVCAGVCCTQSGRARVAWHSILKSSRRSTYSFLLTHGDLQGAQVVKRKSWLILSNGVVNCLNFLLVFSKK